MAVYPAPLFLLSVDGTALLRNLPLEVILTSLEIFFQVFSVFPNYMKSIGIDILINFILQISL